jgi:hypothetical protein
MRRPAVVYQFDDVVLNPETFSVEKSGRVFALEPKSIKLVLFLIQNRSRAIGKDELLSNVWENVAVTDNALARVVAQLRKALGDDAKNGPLHRDRTRHRLLLRCRGRRTRRRRSAWLAGTRVSKSALAPGRRGDSRAAHHRHGRDFLAAKPLRDTALMVRNLARRFTIASHARISPDGRLLAFRAIIDGLSQVAVIKPDTSSWTALTHDRTNGAVSLVAAFAEQIAGEIGGVLSSEADFSEPTVETAQAKQAPLLATGAGFNIMERLPRHVVELVENAG